MIGVTMAMPTLWTTALSMLIAVVPMYRRHRPFRRSSCGPALAPAEAAS